MDVFIQYTKLLIMREDIKNFVTALLLWFHTQNFYTWSQKIHSCRYLIIVIFMSLYSQLTIIIHTNLI